MVQPLIIGISAPYLSDLDHLAEILIILRMFSHFGYNMMLYQQNPAQLWGIVPFTLTSLHPVFFGFSDQLGNLSCVLETTCFGSDGPTTESYYP